jgi:hypothetical protein
VLPAFYSHNCITLAPSEVISASIAFEVPAKQADNLILLVEGWNAQPLWRTLSAM